MKKPFYQHPNALVETEDIGADTRVWAFVHILPGAKIGQRCNICDHCYIEQNVEIGDDVTVKSGIYLWEGARIADKVFLGPNVVFTNDLMPRSKQYPDAFAETYVEEGASIGANSTLVAGITIGEYAMVGAGSVITRDVPPYALVYGNPAKIKGWVDKEGTKLVQLEDGTWQAKDGQRYEVIENRLSPIA